MLNVRLAKEHYFVDIGRLRSEIKTVRAVKPESTLKIDVSNDGDSVELTMNVANLYIVAFKGRDREYQIGELCGENYNNLGMPAKLSIFDLKRIPSLGAFSKGHKLDKEAITLAAVVVSEASRFMGVSMHIQGLLSGAFSEVSLAALNKRYFTMWSAHSALVKSGKFVPGEQIQVEVLL
jgi:hypothetical protein